MDLLRAIATTRAIRRFRPDPIPEADLATILFAASRAPSGSNRQLFRFVLLRDDETSRQAKALIGGVARRRVEREAGPRRLRPGLGRRHVVAEGAHGPGDAALRGPLRGDPGQRAGVPDPPPGAQPAEGASVYPACQNLLLAARALGYGGVITGWHAAVEPELRELLAIPDGVAISACIPLGRPVGGHGPVRRRPLTELVYDGGWEKPAPWAVDPPGTRFAQAGPPRS